MKCPKCGQEYEGSACPNCEPGPEIIVNNADYLRRKEAYEKKQAEKESASSGGSGTFDQRCCRPRGIFRQQLFLPSVQASLRSSSAEVSENAAVRRGGSYSSLYLDRSGSWNSPNSVTEVLSQLIPLRMSFAGVPAISEFSS